MMNGLRCLQCVVLAVPLLLGLAREVGAADGVIQINQARALAGGVTVGDAPGFPVQITETGHYILTSNLDVRGEPSPESVTAISVSAQGATIDLNGFGIFGPTTCTGGPPVTACSPTGTGVGILFTSDIGVVEDGGILGMGNRGIDMSGSSVGVVRRVQVSHSGASGIVLPGGVANRVSATSNGAGGIILGGGSQVIQSSAFNNNGIGIEVGNGSRVRDSISSVNGGSGISAAAAALVERCIANANGDGGITSAYGGIVRDSVASANTTDGIRVGGQASLMLNNSYSNTGDGIEAGDNSTAVGNMVSGNIGYGMNLGTGTGYQGNVVNANTAGTVNGTGLVEMGGNVCGGDSTCP